VTLPTKRFQATGVDATGPDSDPDGVTDASFVSDPFTAPYDYANAESSEEIGVTIYDREEQEFTPPQDPDAGFSPGVPEQERSTALNWEANVFNIVQGQGGGEPSSPVLGATQTVGQLPVGDFGEGYIVLDLYNGERSLNGAQGLPAIGFAAWQFVNGVEAGTLRNFGGTFPHVTEEQGVE